MALNFPQNPTVGQVYAYGSNSWKWNGTSWVSNAVGTLGMSGYSGYSGISGYSGNQGSSGYSGYSGSGSSGYSGYSGISGYSGAGLSGFSGFSGISGYSGSGISGYSGSGISGFSGFSGISGYSGFSGISGYSGFSGISGYSGSGISGYSGSGISGFSGFSGISGYSGSGISGYSGFSGISGWSGISGYSGSGISGFSGFSGTSGYSGFSGISGYSGSGISGYSGFSGSGISGFSGWSGISGYSGAGGGNVVGPASSTNNTVALFDGTTGKLIKSSNTLLGTAAAASTSDFATAAQGLLANTALQQGAPFLTQTEHTSGNPSDGLVIDYLHPYARLSVQANDGIRFYTQGVADTLIAEFKSNGDTDLTGVLSVGGGSLLGGATNPQIAASGSANNYIQLYIHNDSAQESASSDLIAYPNNGADLHGYVDLGINSSTFSDANYSVTGPNEAYLLASAPSGSGNSGNMVYVTDSTGTTNAHQWFVGGFNQAKTAWKMQLGSTGLDFKTSILLNGSAGTSGYVLTSAGAGAVPTWQPAAGDMAKSVYDTNNDGKVNSADTADSVPWSGITSKPTDLVTLTGAQTLTNKLLDSPSVQGPLLVYGPTVTSPSNSIYSVATILCNMNQYREVSFRNINNGTDASADFVAYNDATNADSFFIDMGINSSNFSSATYSIFTPNSGYLYTGGSGSLQPSHLYVGTGTVGSHLYFFSGGTSTSNLRAWFNDDTGNLIINSTTDDNTNKLQVTGSITATELHLSGSAYAAGAVTYPSQLATKAYVDNAASTGIHVHTAVKVEKHGSWTVTYADGGSTLTVTDITLGTTLTTSQVHNLVINDVVYFTTTTNGVTLNTPYFVYSTPTTTSFQIAAQYNGEEIATLINGTGLSIVCKANTGVGATLTNAGTQAVLNVGGLDLVVNDRVAVIRTTDPHQNGIYTVTNIGSASTNWVLTRAADSNKYSPDDTSGLSKGDYFYVQQGSPGAGESYVITTDSTILFGITPITFSLFNAAVTWTVNAPLNLTGTTLSLTGQVAATNGGTGQANVTTGDILYGSGTDTWSRLAKGTAYKALVMNASGTNIEWNAIALNQSAAVSGQLAIANGGTGASTDVAARTALGLAIGTNVQAWSTNLDSWSGLATSSKQDTLVSGTSIKTINSTSILGSGDIAVQATLVSGTNIKTINGTTILGSGNITTTDTNTTYSVSAETTTGGALLRLTDSSAVTDDVKLAAGTNVTITRTDANTITIDATATGGSGSPGGNSGEIQYNNAGSFAGAANVEVENGQLRLISGAIPATPAAGGINIFSRSRAGRHLAHIIGPSGIDVALQPALFGNSIYMWLPGTGTTVAINFGTSFTARNSGTSAAQATPTKASTNAMSSLNRATFGTGTTATGASGIQSAATVAWRGNAANLGGFFFFARFGIETLAADMRAFVGLSANNAAMAADGSTWANTIGIEKGTADSLWYLVQRNATTVTRTSSTCTVTAGQILDLMMFAAPNGSDVTMRLVDAVTGTVYVDNVVLNTTLPVNTAFLYMQAHCQSVTGTTAKLLALNRIYCETDL